jgi:choline kinase
VRLIVLAAGQGFKLDGVSKPLIRDPGTGETVIERYVRLFAGWEITVVVGYQATGVMSAYPALDYVYNDLWNVTGNSYSLALALDERPCAVISADLFFEAPLVSLLESAPANSVVVHRSENKQAHSVRCHVAGGVVESMYLGEPQRPDDAETSGIYKVSDPALVREWRRACMQNRGVFAGLNLPLGGRDVHAVDQKDVWVHEVNTHPDYLALLRYRSKR